MITATFASLFPTLSVLLERGSIGCGFGICIPLLVEEIKEVFDMETNALDIVRKYHAARATCTLLLTRYERTMDNIAQDKKLQELEAQAQEIEHAAKLLITTSIERYKKWIVLRPNQRPAWEDYQG